MNKLILLIGIFTFSTLVLATDGYHTTEAPTCSTGECLYVNGEPIEMLRGMDLEGFEVTEISTNASILDTLSKDSPSCFTGDVENLKNILNALIGNTNSNYYNGGHALIVKSSQEELDSSLNISFDIRSDYSPYNYRETFNIKKCE